MHFEGMSAMDARHLVLAYASVALFQGGYFAWVVRNWLRLKDDEKKSAKPVA